MLVIPRDKIRFGADGRTYLSLRQISLLERKIGAKVTFVLSRRNLLVFTELELQCRMKKIIESLPEDKLENIDRFYGQMVCGTRIRSERRLMLPDKIRSSLKGENIRN